MGREVEVVVVGGLGWAACRGCLIGAAPGYEVPGLECAASCIHQLILQRRLQKTVEWKAQQNGRLFSEDLPQSTAPHTDITNGAAGDWI